MSVYSEPLDDAVQFLRVRGRPEDGELDLAIADALAAHARWLVVDLTGAELDRIGEALLAAAALELRALRGELIVVSPSSAVADRISRHDVASRPALAGSVDQALMILGLLRPSAAIRRPSPV